MRHLILYGLTVVGRFANPTISIAGRSSLNLPKHEEHAGTQQKAQALQADNALALRVGGTGRAWKAKEPNGIISRNTFYSQGISVGTWAYQLTRGSTFEGFRRLLNNLTDHVKL
jgi:hypothetical protein